MRIETVSLKNFGVHRHLDLSLAPMTVITGPNGSGKTTLVDALRLALLGDWSLRGLNLKKDRCALLSEGASDGSIRVTSACGWSADVAIKSGKIERKEMPVAHLDLCCDPARIAGMGPEQLRSVLIDLSGMQIEPSDIAAELVRRGHDPDKVERLMPSIGKQSAVSYAKELAAEARGTWKAHTGETYGSVKADTWTALVPDEIIDEHHAHDDEEISAEIAKLSAEATKAEHHARAVALTETYRRTQCDEKLVALAESLTQRLAELDAAERAPVPADDPALVEEVSAATRRLDAAGAALTAASAEKISAESAPKVTQCPLCTGPLRVRDGQVFSAADVQPHDQQRAADAVRKHAIAAKSVADAKRELDAAQNRLSQSRDAANRLVTKAIAEARTAVKDAEEAAGILETCRVAIEASGLDSDSHRPLDEINADLRAANDRHNEIKARARQAEDAKRAREEAGHRTQRAAEAHRAVQEWTALADAVLTLPGEMLARGLGPINDRLSKLSPDDFVTHDGISLTPTIGPDMAITVGHGRPYRALSASEQWRVDAVLGALVAELSGHRLLILDGFDIVQPGDRKELLAWLDRLTSAGILETCLVLGTLREPPKLPERVGSVWLGMNAE